MNATCGIKKELREIVKFIATTGIKLLKISLTDFIES